VLDEAGPLPPVIAGRYRVVAPLGRGGMGSVHEVERIGGRERLALKVMATARPSAQELERFRREALLTARIPSENVVRIVDADTAPELEGAPFLVMELLRGQDLARTLAQRGAFPALEARAILEQAARGVEAAHGAGIVHRDLKPANLFLHDAAEGRRVVKVLDFGLARDLGGVGVTRTGDVVGTPQYASPEQIRAERGGVGPAADVWAFGILACEVLTGRRFWSEPSVADIIVKIVYYPMTPPSARFAELPAGFDAWFLRSCAQRPQDRWASIRAQIDALAPLLAA
jgi:serine/threonine protein kinase